MGCYQPHDYEKGGIFYKEPVTQISLKDHYKEIRDRQESFTHNSNVASMLCYVLKKLEEKNILNILENETTKTPEIFEWFEDHKKRDKN